MVVEAVGGKRNPNIVPVMIVQFDETKWNDMMAKGMVLGELIHENDPEKLAELDISAIKKNRVTVAQFASKKAIANTPRSPQFKPTIPQNPPVVNISDENSSPSDNSQNQPRETREYTDRELLAGALDSVATSEEDRKKLTQYKKKAAEADELNRTLAELRAKEKALEEAKAKRSEVRAVQDEITKTQNRITVIDTSAQHQRASSIHTTHTTYPSTPPRPHHLTSHTLQPHHDRAASALPPRTSAPPPFLATYHCTMQRQPHHDHAASALPPRTSAPPPFLAAYHCTMLSNHTTTAPLKRSPLVPTFARLSFPTNSHQVIYAKKQKNFDFFQKRY